MFGLFSAYVSNMVEILGAFKKSLSKTLRHPASRYVAREVADIGCYFLMAALTYELMGGVTGLQTVLSRFLEENTLISINGLQCLIYDIGSIFVLGTSIYGTLKTVTLVSTMPALYRQAVVVPQASQLPRYFLSEKLITAMFVLLPGMALTRDFYGFWMGYQLVNDLVSAEARQNIKDKQIISLYVTTGTLYLLLTEFFKYGCHSFSNPVLNALIDNTVYVGLAAVVTNLRLRFDRLQVEECPTTLLEQVLQKLDTGLMVIMNGISASPITQSTSAAVSPFINSAARWMLPPQISGNRNGFYGERERIERISALTLAPN